MPDPIQNASTGPAYDSNWQDGLSQGCDPSTSCCGPQFAESRVVALEPVVIEGDLGTRALLAQHDANQCKNEKQAAAFTCIAAVEGVLLTAATAGSGVGLVIGAGITATNFANCARAVVAHQDCLDQAQAKRDAIRSCEANDGVPLASAREGELICLVTQ